jgi:hypothetical protein
MSKTAVCTYPSCTRCLRCERSAREKQAREVELAGLRATVLAIRSVAVMPGDGLVRRMCENALEGRYPAGEQAA